MTHTPESIPVPEEVVEDWNALQPRLRENLEIYLEDGPRLSTQYNTWTEVVCTTHRREITGGLGAFGMGRMWTDRLDDQPIPPDVPDDCNARDGFGSTCQRSWMEK